MAKKEAIKDEAPKLVKVILPTKEQGWFSFIEIEIDEKVLLSNGKITIKSEPDIFAIFKDQVIVKMREIFKI